MNVLLDTNLLIGVVLGRPAGVGVAVAAVDRLVVGGHLACIVPQAPYEFGVVATRPAPANGLGLSTSATAAELRRAVRSAQLLFDGPAIMPAWERLVVQHDVKGKPAHDARLVAAMAVHGIPAILTFNGADFV